MSGHVTDGRDCPCGAETRPVELPGGGLGSMTVHRPAPTDRGASVPDARTPSPWDCAAQGHVPMPGDGCLACGADAGPSAVAWNDERTTCNHALTTVYPLGHRSECGYRPTVKCLTCPAWRVLRPSQKAAP